MTYMSVISCRPQTRGWDFQNVRFWESRLNYPSVTLTRFFFIFGLEFLGVFNLASVVSHLRPGQLVSHFNFQILYFTRKCIKHCQVSLANASSITRKKPLFEDKDKLMNRSGQVRSVRSGHSMSQVSQVRSGQSGQVRSGQSGQVRSGQVSQVRSGQSGQVSQVRS